LHLMPKSHQAPSSGVSMSVSALAPAPAPSPSLASTVGGCSSGSTCVSPSSSASSTSSTPIPSSFSSSHTPLSAPGSAVPSTVTSPFGQTRLMYPTSAHPYSPAAQNTRLPPQVAALPRPALLSNPLLDNYNHSYHTNSSAQLPLMSHSQRPPPLLHSSGFNGASSPLIRVIPRRQPEQVQEQPQQQHQQLQQQPQAPQVQQRQPPRQHVNAADLEWPRVFVGNIPFTTGFVPSCTDCARQLSCIATLCVLMPVFMFCCVFLVSWQELKEWFRSRLYCKCYVELIAHIGGRSKGCASGYRETRAAVLWDGGCLVNAAHAHVILPCSCVLLCVQHR
jgi:hypothetical protein